MNKFFTSTSAKTFLTATVLMLLMVFSNQVNAQNCTWNYHPNATNQAVPCNNTTWSTPANMGNGAYQHVNLVANWPYYASTNIAKHLTVYDDQPGWTAQTNGAGTSGVTWTSRSSNANGNFISVQNNNTCPQWQAGATSAVLSIRTNFTVPTTVSGSETVCSNAAQTAITASGFNGNVAAFTFDWYYLPGTAHPNTGSYVSGGTTVGSASFTPPATTQTRSWACYFYPTGNSGCFQGWSTGFCTKTVYAAWSAGSITGGAGTICPGAAAGTFTAAPSGGNGSNTIDWYWKPGTSAPSSGGYVYSGTTATTYSPGAIYSTRTYQAYITGGAGCGAGWTSNAITVTVTPPIGAGATSADQTLCNTSSPAALTSLGAAQGGNSAYTYTWQSSTNNSTFGTASGTVTGTGYTPPNTVGTNYYRRSVVDGSGCFSAVNTGTAATLGFVNMNSTVTSTALGTIQKVAGNGVGDGWDGGSGGTARIGPGGYIEARAGTTSAYMMFGLDASDPDYNYNSIDYAMYLNFGTSCIYENGGSPSCPGVAYTTSDVFRVYWNPSTNRIDYMKNGTTFYTSTVVPSSSVYVPDMSIYTVNGSMTNMAVKGDDNATITVYQNPGTATAGGDQNTCALAAVTLAGNAIAVGTGTWSVVSGGTGNFSNANLATSTFTPTSYGAITLRWTFPANGTCAGSSDDVIINSYQSPGTAAAGGDKNTCALAAVAMTGNAIAVGTGTWTVVSGGTGTFANANSATTNFTPTSYGAITLRWTFPANGTCAGSSDDVIVNSYQNPGTASVGATQYRCGTLVSAALGGNAIATGTATWTIVSGGTGTFSNANSGSSTFTANAYGTYVLRWTFPANGTCPGSSADITVNYTEQATTGTTPQSAPCNTLTSTTLGGNTPTLGTGAWSLVGGPGSVISWNPNSATPGATATVSTYGAYTFRWTVTNVSAGCNTTADIVVNYNQSPVLSGPTSICDQDVNVQYNSSIPGVVWSVFSGIGGIGTANGAAAGQYTSGNVATPSQTSAVVIRATNITCSTDYNVTVYNKATLYDVALGLGFGIGNQCSGSIITLGSDVNGVTMSGTGVAGGPYPTPYTWTTPTPSGSSQNYTVTLTNGPSGCGDAASVTVYKAFTLTPASNPSVCDNSTVPFTSTVSATQWSVFSGTGSMSNSAGATSTYTPSNIATPTQSTSTVIIASNGVCEVSRTVTNYNDNTITTANNTAVCDAATPTISGDVSNVTWTFTSSLTGTAVTGPTQNTTLTPGNVVTPTAQSSITVTATNGACTAKSITVLVDNQNTIAEAAGTYGICDAASATTLFTGDVNGTVWSSGTPGNATVATPNVNGVVTPVVIAGSTPNATTVITATNGVCTAVTRTVRVDNNPAITTPTSPACDNTNPDFNLSDVAETNITWSTSHGTITNTGTRGVLTYNVPDPAASQVVTVTATNGACAPTANITLDNQPATPNAGTDQVYYPTVLCGVKTTTLAGSAAAVPGSGTWSQVSGPGTTTYSGGSAPNDNSHYEGATTNATLFGTYVYQWQMVNGSCPSAGDQVTVIYDTVFSRNVTEEPCMSMSEVTYNTPGNINYSYFIVSATGGTTPYTFPADNVPTLRNVGTIAAGTSYAYELDATTSDLFQVTDAVGCPAGSSVVNPSYTSQPTEIAISSGTGSVTDSCHNSYNRWVTYIYDNAGINEAIVSINANGNNLGMVNVNMYRDADEAIVPNSSWAGFTCPGTWMRPMERHFMVTTSNAPPLQIDNTHRWTPKVGVRLYFTHEELTDLIKETYSYNGVPGSSNFGDGCLANDDVTNLNDLYVTKYTAPPGYMNTENNDYSDNIAYQNNPSAIYRLFGDNTTPALGNGPLRKDYESVTATSKTFDNIYGRATPSILGVPQPNHFVEMDVEEFSEFWLHGTLHITPLPVEMLFLEATPVNNAFIQVKWATALEVNNDGFQVERSVDGQTWATIGWVNGNDNTTTQTNYHFDDVNVVVNTVYYYRLKQVDNDGAFEYTDIVSARINGEVSFSVKDFVPNPTMDRTNLIVTASKDQDITVAFYNVVGQKVLESSHQLNKGGNRLEFDLGKLASGTYTAIVSSANDVYTKKVVLAK